VRSNPLGPIPDRQSAVKAASSTPSPGFSQPGSPDVGIGSLLRIVATAYPMAPGATNIE
jgi:hypothetical protein